METDWDVVVAGGGAAGLSAALLLGRARRRVLAVDAGEQRNRVAEHMHGVLGHDGIAPSALIALGRDEIARYGVEHVSSAVVDITDVGRALAVGLGSGRRLRTRALVVATGARDELPDIPGLAEHWGTGVVLCPYCHGWEVRDQRLGVLATSPMGVLKAPLIRQWSDRVVLFAARSGELTDDDERRLRARGIGVVTSPAVELVTEHDRVAGMRTADGHVHPIDALFTESRIVPRDELLAGLELARTEGPFGSFLAVDETGRTSHPRIWAIGNVSNPAATVPMATGAGALAAGFVNMALVTEDVDDAVELAGAA